MQTENYSNPKLMISGRNRERFDLAIQLSNNNKAVGWSEEMVCADETGSRDKEGTKIKTLVFYWAEPDNKPSFNKFPVPLDPKGMAELAWQWLDSLTKDDFKPSAYNDGDVDNVRGWLVFTQAWGHVTGWQSFVGVQPYSCWIGK